MRMPKKLSWKGLQREYIVSRYDSYESIHTEYAYCKFFLRIKYAKYYSSLRDLKYPPIRVSRLLHKWFGWNTFNYNSNITFELVDYSKDQVRYWSPYMNFY